MKCPNGCGLPYKPIYGHLTYLYEVTRDELDCLARLTKLAEDRQREGKPT